MPGGGADQLEQRVREIFNAQLDYYFALGRGGRARVELRRRDDLLLRSGEQARNLAAALGGTLERLCSGRGPLSEEPDGGQD
jgi:hypothetical protein